MNLEAPVPGPAGRSAVIHALYRLTGGVLIAFGVRLAGSSAH
ncbi:hypothetical protein [Metapseudomonas otitidis]|nr:hypothetical protein [Pseudomonas otitidis]